MKAQHRTELDHIITDIQLGMANKKEFLSNLIEQAENYAASQGLDPSTLHLDTDVHYLATLSVTDLQQMGQVSGTHAVILTSYNPAAVPEDDPAAAGREGDAQELSDLQEGTDYEYVSGFFSSSEDNSQMQIAWVLLRHTKDGRTLARYEDRWIPHFNVEPLDGSPISIRNCDICDRRKQCPSYLERVSDDLANGYPRSDIELTKKQKKDMASSIVLRDLAETLGDLEGSFSDSRWEEFKWSRKKLIDLCTASDGVLTFSDNQEGTDAILLSSDASHNGFCIRQRGNYLELCQYMECIDIEDAFDTVEGMLNENALIFRVVGRTQEWRDLLPFVNNYADRMSTEASMYTIPLSLRLSINRRGLIGKNPDILADTVKNLFPSMDEVEQENAIAFLQDLHDVFGKTKFPRMDGGPTASLS
ncbi:MAG: hypothetical protein ACI4OJ_11260 [Lachnospiraceae bacterium]